MVPGKNGGTHLIYFNIIRPFVLIHQTEIDKQINQVKDVITNKMK
jgi:hypothetical protein